MTELMPSHPQATTDPTAAARMAALRRFHILDTDRDAVFDSIAEIAAALLDAPIAVVNFIADDRQWFKAEIGIGQRELPLDVSICRIALPERGIFVVPDLTCDDRFSFNPLVTVTEGLRFYAGMVLESDGVPIGTVCVLDTRPRIGGISDTQQRGLEALAVQAMAALERSATAGRDRYRLELTERLREAAEATAMMEIATEALGRYLGIAQVGFAEIDDDQSHAQVHRDWSDGRVASVVGRWHLDDFGSDFVRDIKDGRTIAIPDVMLDARTNAPGTAASFAGIGVRAIITIALIRDGQMRALLFAHHHEPRDWSIDEVAIVEETVGRIWAAVERARADERLLHSETIARTRAEQIGAIYSAAPVGIAMFDRDLRYVSINERLAQMNGAPAADHIGKTPREVIPGLDTQPDLDAQLTETFNRALAGETILGVQFSGTSAAQPGVVYSWRANYLPMHDATGESVGVVLSVEDITEEQAAHQSLRDSEARYRALFEAIDPGFCVIEMIYGEDGRANDYRFVETNPAFERQSGLADAVGRRVREFAPDLEEVWFERYGRVALTGKPMHVEGEAAPLGRWFDINAFPVGSPEQRRVGVLFSDITERRHADSALRDSEARLGRELERTEIAQAAARAVLYDFDPATGIAKPSPNLPQITGYPSDITITLEWWQSLVHPDDLQMFGEVLETAVTRGNDYSLEYRLLHNDGHWIWVSDRGRAISTGNGLHRLTGMFVDIDEQRQAQQALAESEVRYRAVFEQVGIGVARIALENRFIEINDRYCIILGRKREDVVGKNWHDITHADDLAADVANVDRLIAGHAASYTMEKRYTGEDGSEIWVNLTVSLVRNAVGMPAFFVAMAEDIGARKQAEAALADSEATLRTVLDAAPVGLVFADASGRISHGNARVVEIIGHPVIQSPNTDAYGEYVSFHADGRQVEAREYPLARVLTGEAERAEFEALYRRGDGRDVWIRAVAAAMRSANGTLLGGVVALLDIDRETRLTQQLTHEVEHAVAERQTALAQLFEAQKLETIGQLTGGVAHDFNNLLTPIMGVLEMMQNRVAGEDRASRLVSGALQSAERAKNLVQRLLAFARRQHLETKAIDLADLIAGMRDLIDRSIGPTIAVEVALDNAIGPVSADANQLELALLNLAVNARDAMPTGGELRFAARREEVQVGNALQLGPGSYVCLMVSDTGSGMDGETVKRCIEPFYTSKGIGEGTGLGLSMVHGMMRQLGGALNIVSVPGQGTTMELWLSCSDEKAVKADIERAEPIVAARRSTILLVDDEELVRESTADMLDRLGYDVLQANNGASALELLAGSTAIDALVTDYLMPGMTGRELAARARIDRPELPVLLITGYTRLDEIGPDLARLEKPFRQADFAARVAELVGSG